MSSACLLAFVHATPDGPGWARTWIDGVLRDHLPGYPEGGQDGGHHEVASPRLRSWRVGAVLGREPLVQSRPHPRTGAPELLDDLLRTPAACIVAIAAVQAGDAVGGTPPIALGRFRGFVGARAEPHVTEEHARALREGWPDFVARAAVRESDADLAFVAFLAELHAAGGLGQAYASAQHFRTALTAVDARLSSLSPHHLAVTDGRTLGLLHRGGTLLAFDAPTQAAPKARAPGTGDGPPARLLLWTAGPGPDEPVAGAERIADGILTLEARWPGRMTRAQ